MSDTKEDRNIESQIKKMDTSSGKACPLDTIYQ